MAVASLREGIHVFVARDMLRRKIFAGVKVSNCPLYFTHQNARKQCFPGATTFQLCNIPVQKLPVCFLHLPAKKKNNVDFKKIAEIRMCGIVFTMLRLQISGTGPIFRGKPTARSCRQAKCHRTAIPHIFATQSHNCWHRTAVFQIQKKKKTLSQDVCKAAMR